MQETKPAVIQIKAMKRTWIEANAFKAVTNWLRLPLPNRTTLRPQNDAIAVGAKKALQEFAFDSSARDRGLSIPFLGRDGVSKTGQA